MEMLLAPAAKIFMELGWGNFLIFVLISLFAMVVLQYIKQIKFNELGYFKALQVGNDTNLKHHILFSTAKYKIDVELPNLVFFPGHPVRQMVTQDLVKFYCVALYDACVSISDMTMDNWSKDQWVLEIKQTVSNSISNAKNKALDSMIPEILVNNFTRWIQPSITTLLNHIETIGASGIYSSSIARTNTLFIIMSIVLITIMSDAERSAHSLNGDLTGLIYKGKIIEDVGREED